MTYLAIHFVDPTIPGLSGRDLIERTIESVQATADLEGVTPARHGRQDHGHEASERLPDRIRGGGRRGESRGLCAHLPGHGARDDRPGE